MSFSSDSQSGEGSASDPVEQPAPVAPVDVWRAKVGAFIFPWKLQISINPFSSLSPLQLREKVLTPKDLIDFFKQAAPPLFLLESARNPADLGEWWMGQVVKVPIDHRHP